MFKVRRLQASAIAITLASASILSSRVVADQFAEAPVYSQTLANLNVALAKAGIANLRVDRAEMSVTRDGVNAATTLIANDRTHQLNSQFVASDPRRGGFADLSYLVDQSDGRALSFVNNAVVVLPNSVTEPVIDRGIHRWGDTTQCPSPALTKLADDGTDPDVVDDMVSTLVEKSPGQTEVTIDSDVNIIGTLAQFGRGIIQDVSDQIFDRFVAAVRAQLEPPAAVAVPAAAAQVATTGASIAVVPDAVAGPTSPAVLANPVAPIDVLSTASGAAGRAAGRALRRPALWIGVGAVIVVAYWLFR